MHQLGYKDLVTFTSTNDKGDIVYHTNVMMAIGTGAQPCGPAPTFPPRWQPGSRPLVPRCPLPTSPCGCRCCAQFVSPLPSAGHYGPFFRCPCLRACVRPWLACPLPVPATYADVAVVCLESVEDEAERRNLQQKLSKTHTIVDITREQARLSRTRVSKLCLHGSSCCLGSCRAELLAPACWWTLQLLVVWAQAGTSQPHWRPAQGSHLNCRAQRARRRQMKHLRRCSNFWHFELCLGEQSGAGVGCSCTRAVVPGTESTRASLPLQMAALCGNVLELEDGRGLPVMAMSTRAYNAFTDDQKKVLR